MSSQDSSSETVAVLVPPSISPVPVLLRPTPALPAVANMRVSTTADQPMQHYSATEPCARTERPWGWFETVFAQTGNKIKRIGVHPGQQISLQRHRHRAEHWVVLRGTAHVTVGERELDLAVGQHVDIAAGQIHRLANRTSDVMEILEVQLGEQLDEADIERLQDDYGRA